MRRSCRERGFTIAELMIASSILILLLGVTFGIYQMGAAAWLKSDAKSELLQTIQVVTARLNRDLEGSSIQSASIAANGAGVAFQNARGANGVFVYDPVRLMPKWQCYLIYYFNPTDGIFYRRELSIAGKPQETTTGPIDSLGGGPVENYFSQGRPLGRKLSGCVFSLSPDQQLVLDLTLTKPAGGSRPPERQTARVVTSLRN